MDDLGGLDFEKGCYVGQEVVSRMQHRGTARKRLVKVLAETALPAPGTRILAEGKTLGSLGAVAGATGLAILRLDRLHDAVSDGLPVMAADCPITVEKPAYARFDL